MGDGPPGWWQASDGNWYPPEQRPGAYVPPPAKKRSGCLVGGLLGAGLVVLLVVGVIVAIIVAVANTDTKTKNPGPLRGTAENPATADVTVNTCSPGSTDSLSYPRASGQILNHSSKPSSYGFTISFETADGRRVAQGAEYQSSVAPGQRATWEAQGTQQYTEAIVCKVINVTRFAVSP